MGDGGGIALALRAQFRIVDGPRPVGGQDQSQVGGFGGDIRRRPNLRSGDNGREKGSPVPTAAHGSYPAWVIMS